ncbi:restriction endonuclease subunit S, partial [Fusobacterium gastrosuis]|uniref:restriction endonuclease subunit S n=1 Tax=Fusobacterium gastrosuis TaxID=1755100 RepID=UPI002A966D51|nr:restriction endonuclease subunit S [Fusobacterium gastrosuis]
MKSEKKIKIEDFVLPIEEQPYKIPDKWIWTRLKEIGEYKKGPFGSDLKKSLFVPYSSNAIKVYEQKNAIKKDPTLGSYYISEEYFLEKLKNFEVLAGDIIMSCAGTIGETFIMPKNIEKGVINQALMRIRNNKFVEKNFFLLVFNFLLKKISQDSSKGTAIANIPPFDIFKKLAFPLPPLEEQKRIVEKLDYFSEKINKLKALIEEVKADIENRKISILDKAFKGELTAKWREKNSCSDILELLENINKEKIAKWEDECAEAEKNGNKKPKKPTLKNVDEMIVSEDEFPYEIPDTWRWVRLGDICEIKGGKRIPKGKDFAKEKTEHIYLRVSDFDNYTINKNNLKYISNELAVQLKNYKISVKDIYISIAGTIGKVGIIPKELDKSFLTENAAKITNINSNTNNKFLLNYLKTSSIEHSINTSITSSGQPKLAIFRIEKFLIPLPPLEEQKEIVRTLDEVLERENKISEILKMEEQINLLEKSILNKAFRGELGTGN